MIADRPAVLYARYSPRPGLTESCEAQLGMCRDYCKLHGLEVVNEFRDDGISGVSEDRPGLTAALLLAIKEKAALVVYQLSRFARSTKQAIDYAETLNKGGGDLVCIKESFDTRTSMGKFTFTLFAALAELERNQIRERTSETMKEYQRQGRRMGRKDRVPFGFKCCGEGGSYLQENPKEQDMIREIIHLRVVDRMGYRPIAKEMCRRNRWYRGRRSWNHQTIKKILDRAKIP